MVDGSSLVSTSATIAPLSQLRVLAPLPLRLDDLLGLLDDRFGLALDLFGGRGVLLAVLPGENADDLDDANDAEEEVYGCQAGLVSCTVSSNFDAV